jgi:hypothetical protein
VFVLKDDLIEKSAIIGKGVELEKVRKFCYLWNMLDADGGVDSAVTNRIRCAWNKFRELAPFLTAKILLLLNGFYGAQLCTILADGAEVLGSSSEFPAGQRWPTIYNT